MKSVVAYLGQLGVDLSKLGQMQNSFWSAASQNLDSVKAVVAYLEQLGIDVIKLGQMKGSFWAAASKDLDTVKAVVAYLRQLGVDVSKLGSFGNSFWSAASKDLDTVKGTIEMLLGRGVTHDRLAFSEQFWSGITSNTSTAVRDTLDLLMDEYGFGPASIASLDHSFWAHVKREGAFAEMRDALAAMRLPVHVNRHVRSLNRDRPFGSGATKCKFGKWHHVRVRGYSP